MSMGKKSSYESGKGRESDKRKILLTIIIIILIIICIGLINRVNSLKDQTESITAYSNKLETDVESLKQENQQLTSLLDSKTEEEVENKESEQEKQEQTQDIDEDKKKAYLTFDDGPSKNTPIILDVLKEYDVKATFFVTGKTDEFSKNMYKRIVDEGHSIGIHSYTHDYDEIYESLDNFKADFFKLQDLIYDTTGHKADIYRFPGGSANQFTSLPIGVFVEFLEENDIVYYDWNVINGDYYSQGVTAEESYENVIEGVNTFKNSFVLMHDSSGKETTAESIANIVETLLDEDVAILPLTSEVKPMQQIKVSDVINN